MVAKKRGKKVKTLPTKALSAGKAKTVKGGAKSKGGVRSGLVSFGDIKGESTDDRHKDWIE